MDIVDVYILSGHDRDLEESMVAGAAQLQLEAEDPAHGVSSHGSILLDDCLPLGLHFISRLK
jgi:hypothetical protein